MLKIDAGRNEREMRNNVLNWKGLAIKLLEGTVSKVLSNGYHTYLQESKYVHGICRYRDLPRVTASGPTTELGRCMERVTTVMMYVRPSWRLPSV